MRSKDVFEEYRKQRKAGAEDAKDQQISDYQPTNGVDATDFNEIYNGYANHVQTSKSKPKPPTNGYEAAVEMTAVAEVDEEQDQDDTKHEDAKPNQADPAFEYSQSIQQTKPKPIHQADSDDDEYDEAAEKVNEII